MSLLSGRPNVAERMKPLLDRLQVLRPLLDGHRVHLPVWAVVATRID
jgi:hypothetical protein